MEIVSSFSVGLDKIDLVRCKEVEPECDLMMVMLRATYAKSASKNVESKNENPRLIEEKNIELEVGDKQKSKIGVVEGGLTMYTEVSTKH
ncbi:hypothetical protein PVL29_011859 [Vitis rotundifolia]|uniref:Uncharacterized protein n=1 Tax=Vitis rotundifolia TaxID=103349 RepID=A0AA38ZQI6_VITRO|nr:hypothetical protein PVL29_011859 [Vitis rotundifolia]